MNQPTRPKQPTNENLGPIHVRSDNELRGTRGSPQLQYSRRLLVSVKRKGPCQRIGRPRETYKRHYDSRKGVRAVRGGGP